MSVLIKGMGMPKDCPYCKMAYYNASDEFTGCAVIPGKRYAMHNDAVYAKSTQRPDWCPLVEIPEPHGDLIDRDTLNIGEYEREDDDTGTLEISLRGLLDLYHKVKDAPTVIEAEGSENQC